MGTRIETGRTRLTDRASVAGRVILAAASGYGIAALATAFLALTLPLTRSEAVTTATLLSFLVMVCVIVCVFAMRSFLRAAVTTSGIALVLLAALWAVKDAFHVVGGAP